MTMMDVGKGSLPVGCLCLILLSLVSPSVSEMLLPIISSQVKFSCSHSDSLAHSISPGSEP